MIVRFGKRIANRLSRRGNKGLVLVLLAWITGLAIGFVGMAVDVGYVYTIRDQLRQALDMAALRGAVEMIAMPSDPAAIRPVVQATLEGNPVMGDTEVNWRWTLNIRGNGSSVGDTVVLNGYYYFSPFFMSLFGFDTLSVYWQSRAKLVSVISAYCFVPYTLTDRFNDTNGNGYWDAGEQVVGYDGSTDIGQLIYVKYHDPTDRPHQNWVYGVYYEEGPGYDEIWCNSGDQLIQVGSHLNRIVHAPGIMTLKADARYDDDPWAYWDDATNTVQSPLPEHEIFKCPRIVKVPIHHPQNPDVVTKFLCVFIEEAPNGADSVLVRTMNILNVGDVGYSDGVSFVKSARLVLPPG